VEACLSLPLAPLSDANANQSIFDILEKTTGKTIVWIPALTDDDRIVLGRGSRYRDVLSSLSHAHRATVKDALDFLLTGMSEFGPHGLVRIEPIADDNVINIAIITRSHILIVALPDS
jgi:hypothetical protein